MSVAMFGAHWTVPIHGHRPLKIGLLRHLAKLAAMSDEDLQ
jgi:predicted RNA binding protein YcfA (HicA-like mRNA interferase family)